VLALGIWGERASGHKVKVKKSNLSDVTEKVRFEKEKDALEKSRPRLAREGDLSDRVCELLASCADGRQGWIVLEDVQGSTLKDLIDGRKKSKGPAWDEKDALAIVIQLSAVVQRIGEDSFSYRVTDKNKEAHPLRPSSSAKMAINLSWRSS
jgi:hypothetical protein